VKGMHFRYPNEMHSLVSETDSFIFTIVELGDSKRRSLWIHKLFKREFEFIVDSINDHYVKLKTKSVLPP
jgi:hypothetical protein